MNFSKLLCLVLVCSEPFGQVLADTTPVCNGNVDGTTIVQCRGKKGGAVKLKVTATVTANDPDVEWHKDDGASKLTSDNTEYTISGTNSIELEILNLADSDEGEYEAKQIVPVEKFNVQVADCYGSKSSIPGLCQGKSDGSIKLALSDDGGGSTFSWKKGTTPIATGPKYDGPVNAATLTIKDLDDNDNDAVFTGGPTGSEAEKFSVRVAPVCLASSTPCVGKLSRDLILKVGGTATQKVTWKKDGNPVTERYVKSGANEIELRIPSLVANDAGTYTAEYTSTDVESFTVSIQNTKGTSESDTKKESTENGKDNNSGGGGSSNSGTDQVNLGKGAGDPGGVGGLSYSPALLVTVTLVHLLLQLAA